MAAETQIRSKKRLTEQDVSFVCLFSDKHDPNLTTAFSQGYGHTGLNSRLPTLSRAKNIQIEAKKAEGYGAHMRCAEVVDAIFLKGHVVDPEQARPYRIVSNILNILIKIGPSKDHATRLRQKVRPGNGGLVAQIKKPPDALNNPLNVDERSRSFSGEEELKQEAQQNSLNNLR